MEVAGHPELTGTFFCERTTAQSLPRTPIAMMLAAVIALNAYSAQSKHVSALHGEARSPKSNCGSLIGSRFRRRNSFGRENAPTWYSLPCSEKIVMCRSNAVPATTKLLAPALSSLMIHRLPDMMGY